jgi:hypothetical protein
MSGGVEYTMELFATFTVPASGTVNVTLTPTFNNDAVQAAAVMGQILTAQNYNGGMGILDGSYKVRTNQGCTALTPPTDSCFRPSEDIVYVGTTVSAGYTDSHWKFVIAHEMGHMVSYRAMGRYQYNYDDSAAEASCRCDHYDAALWGNRTHCLQSREHIGGAMNEGFSHAFAARTFNFTQFPEGRFVYYKPRRNDDGTVTNPPFAVDAFGHARWMSNHCAAAGKGTEWDWLTFYFSLASSSSANNTPFSTLFAIYNRACTGSATTRCSNQAVGWATLQSAAQAHYGASDSRFIRFRDGGVIYAVNY